MDYRSPSPPPSSDLRPLLIVVGILMCLVGAGCGMGCGLYTLATPLMLQGMGGAAPDDPELQEAMAAMEQFQVFNIIGAIFYLLAGVFVLWLGVGVIRCRRWAWKLSLALGWFWIGAVAITTLVYLVMAPAMVEWFSQLMATTTPPPSPGSPSPATPPTGVMLGVGILFLIVMMGVYAIPGLVLIIIFGLRNVRLTCEYYDPTPRWTDRVPVPVLILWLLLAMATPGFLTALPVWLGLGPVRMFDVNPVVGGVTCVIGVILSLMGAIGLSRMKFSGWLAGFTVFAFFGAMSAWAMRNFSFMSFYEGIMSEEELQMMGGLMENLPVWQMTVGFTALILLYMLFLLRYFRRRPAVSTGGNDPGNPYHPPGLT